MFVSQQLFLCEIHVPIPGITLLSFKVIQNSYGFFNISFIEIHNVQSQEISNKVEKSRDLLSMLFPH